MKIFSICFITKTLVYQEKIALLRKKQKKVRKKFLCLARQQFDMPHINYDKATASL